MILLHIFISIGNTLSSEKKNKQTKILNYTKKTVCIFVVVVTVVEVTVLEGNEMGKEKV